MGSKVKFRRFYLILNAGPADTEHFDSLQIYYKFSACLKKILSSSKLGEASFKPNQLKGDYFCAHESHNDTLRCIEEAITATGLNENNKRALTIGL